MLLKTMWGQKWLDLRKLMFKICIQYIKQTLMKNQALRYICLIFSLIFIDSSVYTVSNASYVFRQA